MYAALWRLLPGPRWVKALQFLALALAVAWVLLAWAFPAIEPHLPLERITVG